MERSPDMLCLLCQINQATKTNSHFIPVGYTKSLFGKRDMEEIHTVDSGADQPIDKHLGTSNLKGVTDPDSGAVEHSVENPVTADYIFCPSCEEKLGNLESEMIPFLTTKMFNKKYSGQYSDKPLGSGEIVRKLDKQNLFKIDLFFLSLVWRENLQYRFKQGKDAFKNPRIAAYMRAELYRGLESDNPPDDNWLDRILYCLICPDRLDDATANAVCSLTDHQSPYVIFLDKYIFTFVYNLDKHGDIPSFLGKDSWPIEDEFVNLSSKPSRYVTIIKSEVWRDYLGETFGKIAQDLINELSIKLASLFQISADQANELIRERACEMQKEDNTEENFGDYYVKAYHELINNAI